MFSSVSRVSVTFCSRASCHGYLFYSFIYGCVIFSRKEKNKLDSSVFEAAKVAIAISFRSAPMFSVRMDFEQDIS